METFIILFVVFILISSAVFAFISIKRFKNYKQDETLTISGSDTIYNDSPVLWEKKKYEPTNIKFHKNNNSNEYIFIIDNVDIYQKILLDIFSKDYNIYFFNDGEDFLFFFKNTQNDKIKPKAIIATDDCAIINGPTLFNLIFDNSFFFNSKKIILTHNRHFLSKKNIPFVLKPFNKDNKQIVNMVN